MCIGRKTRLLADYRRPEAQFVVFQTFRRGFLVYVEDRGNTDSSFEVEGIIIVAIELSKVRLSHPKANVTCFEGSDSPNLKSKLWRKFWEERERGRSG